VSAVNKCSQLKKVDAAALPDTYAAALRVAFERTARYNAPEVRCRSLCRHAAIALVPMLPGPWWQSRGSGLLTDTMTPACPSGAASRCRVCYLTLPAQHPFLPVGILTHAVIWDFCVPQEDFTALADRIAASYAGFNASAAACDVICRAGAAFALRNAPRNLEFLAVRFDRSQL